MLFNYLMLTVDCGKAELLLRAYALQMHIAKANSVNSGATYLYRKEKETYEWIFSWLSSLAVLLVGAFDGGVAQHAGHNPANMLSETCKLDL